MKKKNIADKIDAILKFCTSKDETRPALAGYCHFSKIPALVTTNGHVAAIMKSGYQQELADLVIDPANCRIIKREYPNIQAVIPALGFKGEEYTIEPRHFIKSTKRAPIKIFFCADGIIKMDRPEKFLFALNASYLKPLADGSTYRVRYIDDLKPILFDISNADFSDVMIIMPVRV